MASGVHVSYAGDTCRYSIAVNPSDDILSCNLGRVQLLCCNFKCLFRCSCSGGHQADRNQSLVRKCQGVVRVSYQSLICRRGHLDGIQQHACVLKRCHAICHVDGLGCQILCVFRRIQHVNHNDRSALGQCKGRISRLGKCVGKLTYAVGVLLRALIAELIDHVIHRLN